MKQDLSQSMRQAVTWATLGFAFAGCSQEQPITLPDKEVTALRERISELEEQVALLSARPSDQLLAEIVSAIEAGKIAKIEGDLTVNGELSVSGVLRAKSLAVTDEIVVGADEATQTVIGDSQIELRKYGITRAYWGQDSDEGNFRVVELVFKRPVIDQNGNLLGMKPAIEIEEHRTWWSIKMFNDGSGPSPMLEFIFLRQGEQSPPNMPYLKDGHLNVIFRAKENPVRLLLQDSTQGDKDVAELTLKGSDTHFEVDPELIKLSDENIASLVNWVMKTVKEASEDRKVHRE